MENTLNKNVKNYYETTVDVIFKWLEFQNSFGRIPNISWFTFSPQLHEIKQETLENLSIYLDERELPINQIIIRQTIISIIITKLEEKGLEEVIPYVTNIDEKEMIDLTNALYLRKNVLRIISNHPKLDNDSKKSKVYNTYMNELRWLRLSTSFKHDDFKDNISPIYLEMLPMEHDETRSEISYMQAALFYINRLDNIAVKMTNSEYNMSPLIDDLQEELDEIERITSIDMLIQVITLFERHITQVKEINNEKNTAKSLKLTSN